MKMNIVFLVAMILDSQVASSKEVLCVSDVAFTIITEIFNNSVDINVRLYCPLGYHCVGNTDSPCQPNYIPTTLKSIVYGKSRRTTKQMKQTEPPTSIGEPVNCHGSGYHQADKCNEYIECAPLYLWFKAVKKTCKIGYFYSEANKPCSMPPNVVCTNMD